MDQGFSDQSFDDDIDIEAIYFTESLASRRSFENYLFDNKAQRRTVHTMDVEDLTGEGNEPEPIYISSDIIRTTFLVLFGDPFERTQHR